MSRKKLNPRNIPMTGRSINIDAIIDEAMRNDMNHAKLLVGNALLNRMSLDEINEMLNSLHEFDVTEAAVSHAEQLMGITERPTVDLSTISTGADLKKFKAKMKKLALHTALCSICLCLEENGYTPDQLKSIFAEVEQTKSKIDCGEVTYKVLKNMEGMYTGR